MVGHNVQRPGVWMEWWLSLLRCEAGSHALYNGWYILSQSNKEIWETTIQHPPTPPISPLHGVKLEFASYATQTIFIQCMSNHRGHLRTTMTANDAWRRVLCLNSLRHQQYTTVAPCRHYTPTPSNSIHKSFQATGRSAFYILLFPRQIRHRYLLSIVTCCDSIAMSKQ